MKPSGGNLSTVRRKGGEKISIRGRLRYTRGADKFLVVVNGSGSAADMLVCARAIDIAKLSKM